MKESRKLAELRRQVKYKEEIAVSVEPFKINFVIMEKFMYLLIIYLYKKIK